MVYIVDASIIIPVYNRAALVRNAVMTACRQRFPVERYEVIVIDDGSTDGSLQQALNAQLEFGTPRGLRVSGRRLDENLGSAAAKNAGLNIARGETILFQDSDDEIRPDALQTLHAALMQHPEVGFVWPTFRIITGDHATFTDTNYGSGTLFLRSVFDRVGPFNPTLRTGEYEDLFTRLRAAGIVGRHVDAAVYHYYQTPKSLTRNGVM